MKTLAEVFFILFIWYTVYCMIFTGELGKPCRSDGTCDAGLICEQVQQTPFWFCELPEPPTRSTK